jgi:hypothetical protein
MYTLLDGIAYSDYTLSLSSGRAWNYKRYELTAFERMSQAGAKVRLEDLDIKVREGSVTKCEYDTW